MMVYNDYRQHNSGNTTRSVDAMIQKVFEQRGEFVEVVSLPSKDGKNSTYRWENRNILDRMVRRLAFEHPHVVHNIKMDKNKIFIKVI